jgi:predicted Fe-S protein YdhL (DUF1289 family)
MAVPSPCISVCRVDPATRWCLGCARTLDEIAAWSALDDTGKRAVWAQLPARHEQLGSASLAAAPARREPTRR